MNKKGNENRSVRNTKKKLRDGLISLMETKPLNEISVKELTELVDVNRGTFYFHYADLYDLLHQYENEFFEQFDLILQSDIKTKDETYPYLLTIFSYIGENCALCRILLGVNGDMQFLERIKATVDERCSYFWRHYAPVGKPEDFSLYNAFIINGCIGVITNWLNDGLEESPEEISRLAGTIITASFKPYFNKQ